MIEEINIGQDDIINLTEWRQRVREALARNDAARQELSKRLED